MTVTLSSDSRPVLLRVLANKPAAVTQDGIPLPHRATAAQFAAAATGWREDEQAGLVFTRFQHAGGVTKVHF